MMITKKMTFQMSALNKKQMWLCAIITNLRLIKYLEHDEEGIAFGHAMESPITGKPLSIWWSVESNPVIYNIFRFIWNSRFFYDKEARKHFEELVKLGWVTINEH